MIDWLKKKKENYKIKIWIIYEIWNKVKFQVDK